MSKYSWATLLLTLGTTAALAQSVPPSPAISISGASASGGMTITGGNATGGALQNLFTKSTYPVALPTTSYEYFSLNGGYFLSAPKGSTASGNLYSNITLGNGAGAAAIPNTGLDYLTAIGFNSAGSLTTADHTTCLGAWSCNLITTSSHNTALGIDTLRNVVDTSSDNTIVGEQAGVYGSANGGGTINQGTYVGRNAGTYFGGTYNTLLGYFAGQAGSSSPVTGNDNTGLGAYTLVALQGAASDNTAVGMYSSGVLSSGSGNTTLGSHAGFGLTLGGNNTILGTSVGTTFPTTGTGNILVGFNNSTGTASGATTLAIGIGSAAKPGSRDVCIGILACGGTNQDTNQNVAVGDQALAVNTNGSRNTAIGALAGSHINGGYYNTSLGSGAAATTLVSGHDNIDIGTPGNLADTPAAGSNFTLNIGNVITATGLNAPSTSVTTIGGLETVTGALTLNSTLTAASLTTSGTVAGSICATSSGLILYKTSGCGLNGILSGTTGSIGGGALIPGACVAGTATVTGATSSMVATASPSADPDSSLSTGISIYAFVSAADTVTVRVCAIVAVTPTAVTYNARVIQ